MKTDDLIQQLSGQLKPVRPMISPLRLTLLFGLLGVILIGAGFAGMKTRADLQDQLSNPQFLFEIAISFALALSALALSTFLSRPGRGKNVKWLEKVVIGWLAIILIYDGFRIAQLRESFLMLGFHWVGIDCFLSVMGYSIVMGAAVIHWLRKGASVNPGLSGLVIGTAAVGIGNVAIAFSCGIKNAMHMALWHFSLPMITAAVVGFVVSRLVLKW